MKKRLLIILCVLLTMLGISSCRNYYVPVLIPGVNTPNENTPTDPNNPGDDGSEDNPNNPDDTKPENPDGEDGDNPNPDEGGETDPSNPSGGDEDNPTNPDEGEETNPDTGEEKPNPDEGEGGEEVNPNPGEGEDEEPANPEDQIVKGLVYDKFNDILTILPEPPAKTTGEGYTEDEAKVYASIIKDIRNLNDEGLKTWVDQEAKLPTDYPTNTSSISEANNEVSGLITALKDLEEYSNAKYSLFSVYNNNDLIALNFGVLDNRSMARAIANALDISYLFKNFPSEYEDGIKYKYYLPETWTIMMVGGDGGNYTYKEGSEKAEYAPSPFDLEASYFSNHYNSHTLTTITKFSTAYDDKEINITRVTINETDNYYYYEFPELYNGISEIFVVNDEICYVYGTEYNGYYSL